MTVRELAALVKPHLERAFFPAGLRLDRGDLRIVRAWAYCLFGFMLAAFAGMSIFEHDRWSLTQDFAAIDQVWHEIGHGNLNPKDTVDHIARYWQVHFELYVWLIAPFSLIFGSLFLSLFQDACGFVASVIAFRWVLSVLYDGRRPVPARRTLALCSLIIVTLNPWLYWTYAFDFHSEPVAIAALVASGYAFWADRLVLGYVLALSVLLEGDVTGTYLVGLGVSLAVAKWRKPWIGLSLIPIGVVWLQFTHAIGAGIQSAFNATYGYLIYGQFIGGGNDDPVHQIIGVRELAAGIVQHPLRVLDVLKDKVVDVYANLAPSGFIGILSPWSFGVCFLALAENQLAYSYSYSQPIFQSIPLYIFAAVGFGWMLAAMSRRFGPRLAVWYGVITACNVIIWSCVWIPELPIHWVRISSDQARVLRQVKAGIGNKDQVLATQGVVGAFADRAAVGDFWFNPHIPREANDVQIVVAPFSGVNVESVNRSLTILDTMVTKYNARVRLHDQDIWWLTTGGLGDTTTAFDIPAGQDSVPGWACAGEAAYPITEGPPSEWHAFSNYARGYVIARAYWRMAAGNYHAQVDLASTEPAAVEVWDSTSDELIGRTLVPPTRRRSIGMYFRNLDRGVPYLFEGLGPFRIDAIEPPIHDAIEVRVFSPGTGTTSVYRVTVSPVGNDDPAFHDVLSSR